MAQRTGKDFLVALINGWDIRPYTNELPTFRREKVVEDNTVLGQSNQRQASAALRRAAIAHKGFYDDDVAIGSVPALSQLSDTPVVGCWALAGNVIGSPFTGFSGQLQQNFERAIKTGALTHADAAWAVTGPVGEGVVLFPQGPANSASGVATSVDNGYPTTSGGAVYLQVPALVLGDRTSLVATVQHAPDNATWATLATFAGVTAANNGQRISLSGFIDRYTRTIYSWSGGTSGQSATMFAGIVRFNALAVANSLLFDGTFGYVRQTLPAALKTANISLACWVNTTNAGSTPRIVAAEPRGTNAAGLGIALQIGAGSKFVFQKGPNAAFVQLVGGTTAANGTWYFVAATFDGTNMILYVNGVQDGILNSTSAIGWTDSGSGFPIPAQLYFGAFRDNSAGANTTPNLSFFAGNLGVVRWYNRALTAAEVLGMYNQQLPLTGLVGEWRFDEAGGLSVLDTSGNGNNGIIEAAGAVYDTNIPARAA